METYRYGNAWKAIGATFVVAAVVLPALMVVNGEAFDRGAILGSLGMAVAGVLVYAYYAKYRLAIAPEGFTVYRLGRQPMVVAWRDVVSLDRKGEHLVFRTTDHRKIAISLHFPGYDALETTAARHLPDSAFR